MSKEFKKKYMHPTRRKLMEMVQTGEYDKNTTIGYTKAEEKREVGDVWEDKHNRYEKKEGYILKTGKNSEAFDEIRKYIQEKNTCKNSECKTIKVTDKDKKFISKGGYCMNCTVDMEHELRVKGVFKEYETYKVTTRMIIYGKQKLEELKQSLSDVQPFYEYVNEDGSTEKWELPTTVEEAKKEIQELIDNGEKELEEIEQKRIMAFAELKKRDLEHYL